MLTDSSSFEVFVGLSWKMSDDDERLEMALPGRLRRMVSAVTVSPLEKVSVLADFEMSGAGVIELRTPIRMVFQLSKN